MPVRLCQIVVCWALFIGSILKSLHLSTAAPLKIVFGWTKSDRKQTSSFAIIGRVLACANSKCA